MKIEKRIEDEIERLRNELEKKVFESGDLNSPLILNMSKKLDEVIVKYITGGKQ